MLLRVGRHGAADAAATATAAALASSAQLKQSLLRTLVRSAGTEGAHRRVMAAAGAAGALPLRHQPFERRHPAAAVPGSAPHHAGA
jgi:hypothetical protein